MEKHPRESVKSGTGADAPTFLVTLCTGGVFAKTIYGTADRILRWQGDGRRVIASRSDCARFPARVEPDEGNVPESMGVGFPHTSENQERWIGEGKTHHAQP